MLRFIVYLCCLCAGVAVLALQLDPSAFEGNGSRITLETIKKPAPKTMPAIGKGMIDPPVKNAGFNMPIVTTNSFSSPQRRDKELKGPVRGIRHYNKSGRKPPVLQSAVEYDRQGRLIRKMEYERGVATSKQLVTFNLRGNRTEVTYGLGYYSVCGYDSKGRSISTRIYNRNGRGDWVIGTCETKQYDQKNRLIHWMEGTDETGRKRVWIRYTPDGQIARKEQVADNIRTIEECQFDSSKRVVNYTRSVQYQQNMAITWTYNDQGTLVTKKYEIYDNGPNIERYYYNLNGKLLTYERCAWVYRMLSADCSSTTIATPRDKRFGDPQLCFRTVYSYGQANRLSKVEHFDGNGMPAYKRYNFYPPPREGCCDSLFPAEDPMAYARIDYTYDKVGVHWTAYNADGEVALRPQYDSITYGRGQPQPFINYKYPAHFRTDIFFIKPRIRYDRYGNWIRKAWGTEASIRKISYF